jgi:CubicO group peptidase (beta-lactamase class C family)
MKNEGTWQRLGEFVSQEMKKQEVPGVAVGILHEGETSIAGFGVTSVENPLPVTGETLFQIGSITKTFLSTAVLRLVAAEKLDLDAPLRTYLPDFRVADEEASVRATLRHCLTHTGGWAGDYFHSTGAGDDALARYVADMAGLPQVAPIGTLWSYNNAGFALAGHVIEQVTDQRFEAALKEWVLEPLGLERCFFEAGDVISRRFAVGHNVGDEGPAVARPWAMVRSTYPMGGIACDVAELLRYARFHLGGGQAADGSSLVSAEALREMHSPQVVRWGAESWGLGWATQQIGDTLQVSHGGGTKGQVTLLALIPEHGFALAVLTNADRGGFVTDSVRRWALKEILAIEDAKPQPIESPAETLAEYAGRYRGFFDDLELGLLGGKLVGQATYKRGFPSEDVPPAPAPPPMSVTRCEEDRLLVLDGPFKDALGDIVRKEDGSIGWLRFSGRLHVREV